MNIFEEKTDSELLSYFSDYQKLCSLDKCTGFQNPDFTAILKSYREKFGPIGEGVLGHDFFEAVFHRWEKTMSTSSLRFTLRRSVCAIWRRLSMV